MVLFSLSFGGKPLYFVAGLGSLILLSDLVYSVYVILYNRKSQSSGKEVKKKGHKKLGKEKSRLKKKLKSVAPAGDQTAKSSQLVSKTKTRKDPYWFRYLDRTQEFWKVPQALLWNTVLFFPEVYPEQENSQTRQFMWYMQQAKTSLKLAVYTVNYRLLEQALISLSKKKVRVTIVVNNRRGFMQWRKHGIQAREKPKLMPSPHGGKLFLDHMHNKFIIIDDVAVCTGSLNWTSSAVMENRENVVITDHADSVKLYVQEFDHLWKISDPRLQPKKEDPEKKVVKLNS